MAANTVPNVSFYLTYVCIDRPMLSNIELLYMKLRIDLLNLRIFFLYTANIVLKNKIYKFFQENFCQFFITSHLPKSLKETFLPYIKMPIR